MNRVPQSYKIELLNEVYTIMSDEDQAHVNRIAQMINECSAEFARTTPTLAPHRLAVLTALHFASAFAHRQDADILQEKSCAALADLISQYLAK